LLDLGRRRCRVCLSATIGAPAGEVEVFLTVDGERDVWNLRRRVVVAG
jgi:hypothetical protein